MMLTCVLGEFLDDNGSRWHVDSDSQGLGCEYDLNESLHKAFLDSLFEHWNHACVMTCNTSADVV